MYRGTTPTLVFTLPIEASSVTVLNIAIAQIGRVVISRSLDDVVIDGNDVKMTLTEEETLQLRAGFELSIQVRAGVGESRMASQVFRVPVERILQEGMLSEL